MQSIQDIKNSMRNPVKDIPSAPPSGINHGGIAQHQEVRQAENIAKKAKGQDVSDDEDEDMWEPGNSDEESFASYLDPRFEMDKKTKKGKKNQRLYREWVVSRLLEMEEARREEDDAIKL